MVKTIEATYDGSVFLPAEPVGLAANTRVLITVETPSAASAPSKSFLDTACELNLDGPEDWSDNLHRYLYGEDADSAE